MAKILIVDDEPKVINAIIKLLVTYEYEVISACNGRDALQKAKEDKPDLILLDILMPGMNGSAVAAALKKDIDTQDIPVIFLTCLATGIQTGKDELKANVFVAKSFEPEELLAMINKTLRQK